MTWHTSHASWKTWKITNSFSRSWKCPLIFTKSGNVLEVIVPMKKIILEQKKPLDKHYACITKLQLLKKKSTGT